jgi:hypothetical protein
MSSYLLKNRGCFEREIGGPEGTRTPDLLHAMQTRSQLRHRPVRQACKGDSGYSVA